MLEDRIVYLNREFVAWDMATVHQLSHSFSRGSSIFEVISLYETDMGPAIFRLDRHLDRFYRSAELLGMGVPITREEFHRAVIE
ncbi:MAG: branched-chain amino acid transaminase, partial [Deltaproteobacteria bacterium]|nr:branched-chain amino acid transaminase [Deltaproteobacteria bacterium]